MKKIIKTTRRRFRNRVPMVLMIVLCVYFCASCREKTISEKTLIKEFHLLYDQQDPYCIFLGVPSSQYPADNWVMQEIIYDVNPDLIIEAGTYKGGTALFFATILEQLNEQGKVITIDIEDQIDLAAKYPLWQERVEPIIGDSVSAEVISYVKEKVDGHSVVVFLDSDHSKEHVLKELNAYAPMVSVGGYIIVNDTCYNSHPIPGPPDATMIKDGPWEAVQEFLRANPEFELDHSREKHLVSQNTDGFLKRVALSAKSNK